MVIPLIAGVGMGMAGAGALGSILGSKSLPQIDVQPILEQIRKGAQRQKDISSLLPGKLAPLGSQYQTGVTGALDEAQTAGRASANQFLTETGKTQDLQGKELSDVLQQRVLGALPEQQAALREQLAATGGLQRGAAGTAMEDLSRTAMGEIGAGEQQLAVQSLQNRQAALDKINTMDNQFIMDRLGIDKDTLTQLYQSGRQDLINEANQLLGIEGAQSSAEQQALEFAASQGQAGNIASQQAQNQIWQALMGAGGTMAGAGYRPSAVAGK